MPFNRTIRRWRCAECGCPSARHFTRSIGGRRVLRSEQRLTPCAVCPMSRRHGENGPKCRGYRAEAYEEVRRW